jgi:hypothetical protein
MAVGGQSSSRFNAQPCPVIGGTRTLSGRVKPLNGWFKKKWRCHSIDLNKKLISLISIPQTGHRFQPDVLEISGPLSCKRLSFEESNVINVVSDRFSFRQILN